MAVEDKFSVIMGKYEVTDEAFNKINAINGPHGPTLLKAWLIQEQDDTSTVGK